MDTTHLDLRVRFDEDFSFESPSLPCSSSGSYSTPSTASPSQDPFTPMSGRSTPGLQPLLMDHDNVVCGTSASFGLTPPASTFNGYYPSETRSDSYRYMGYESFSATPSRRASVQAGAMDYECAPMMPTPMASRNTSYQSTNGPGLGNQPFADQIASSPLEFPPPPYPLDNSAYDTAPSWTWPGDSPVNFFERHNSPSTANLQNVLLGESHYVSPQNFPHHGTRRLCLDGVQQKTTALHRVQRYRPSKRSRQPKTTSIGEKSVIVFTRGSHSCPKDDCIGRKPFRRQEHLKRHLKTVHGNQEEICTECKFCKRLINRRDNWRDHIARHANRQSTGRVKYYEDAQAVLDEEMKTIKQRNHSKKEEVHVKTEE